MNSFTTPANAAGWKLQSMVGCTIMTDDAAERSALQLLKYTKFINKGKIAETNPIIENNLNIFLWKTKRGNFASIFLFRASHRQARRPSFHRFLYLSHIFFTSYKT